jgi:hypothetical protein
MPFRLAERSFDLSSDDRDCLCACAFEFGYLDRRAERVSNERGVAEDFVRMTSQLELFNDFRAFVSIYHDACDGYATTKICIAK